MTTRKRIKQPLKTARAKPSTKAKTPTNSTVDLWKLVKTHPHAQHLKYIMGRLWYLLIVLGMGFLIQWAWNAAMIKWCGGDHQVNLFEAAILWVCVY